MVAFRCFAKEEGGSNINEHELAMEQAMSPRCVSNASFLTQLNDAFHTYTKSGLEHSKTYRYMEALDYHYAAMQCAVQLKNAPKENVAVGNLGLTCFKMNDRINAVAYFDRHLALSIGLQDLKGQYRALKYLGDCATASGEFAKAAHCHRETLRIAEYIGDAKTAGAARMRVGIAVANEKMHSHMKRTAVNFFNVRPPQAKGNNALMRSTTPVDSTFLTNMQPVAPGRRGSQLGSRTSRPGSRTSRPATGERLAPLTTAR